MANERPHAYDFFMIVCGPVALRARIDQPAATLDLIDEDITTREKAWKKLDLGQRSAISGPPGGAQAAARRIG
ncbi:MAG: hypothetical protein NT113_05885 [Hyphomicrobiales bacterium]|nr:hypothetical protein [Hyphomicrobiales bacterium]